MHIPVLQKEVLEYLDPKPNQNFIDCTINGGGHSLALLEKNAPKGKILGIDSDSEIVKNLESKISKLRKRLILICSNFADLKEIVKRNKFQQVSGILFDLGFSSWHIEQSRRGFSFFKKEPLDMRYDLKTSLTGAKILNYWAEPEIEGILKEYGQEQFAKKIAQEIIKARRFNMIQDTFQLNEIVRKAIPSRYLRQRIHFATRTFQALRIAVNNELNNLEKVLPQALEILNTGGRMVIISFHSLEDKIVKNFFKEQAYSNSIKILTKKPIIPGLKEIKINPRSRSAKLRAVEKLLTN